MPKISGVIGSNFVGGRLGRDINNHNYPPIISISCHLKEISNLILQHHLIVSSYKQIKKKVYRKLQFPQYQKVEYDTLKQELQYGWGIVAKFCANNTILPLAAIGQYYNINLQHIDHVCVQAHCAVGHLNIVDRAVHYLVDHLTIPRLLQVHDFNYLIVSKALLNKGYLNIHINNGHNNGDTRIFLAKMQLSLELERDWAKEIYFHHRNNLLLKISDRNIAEIDSQASSMLTLCTRGALVHYKMDCGSYDYIGQMLNSYIQQNVITVMQLVDTFRIVLRSSNITVPALQNNQLLIEKIKSYVELMFFTEVKRNSAALLTNAMFWDLVEEGVYAVTDIARKMPMAMEDAVSASTTIDKRMGINRYDYRDSINNRAAQALNIKDGKLILDWFLQRNLEDTVITTQNHQPFNENSTVNDLNAIIPNFIDPLFLAANAANLCTANAINFSVQRTYSDNDNNIIVDAANQPVQFHANGTIMIQVANGVLVNYIIQMLHVENIAFYHIINNWYGILLPDLNNNIMRAMAEQQDPDEDSREQDGYKVLADDNMDIQLDIEPTTKVYSASELQNLGIPMQYDVSYLGEVGC